MPVVVTIEVLLWVALVSALLGRYFWVLDLFSHFRLQYAVLFAACAALLWMRRRELASLAVFGALLSVAPVVAYVSEPTAQAAPEAPTLRLVTFNTWFRNHDYARIARFLEETQADVIVLQELSREAAVKLCGELHSYPYSQLADTRYGAVVLSRWPIVKGESIALTPGTPRAAHVVIDWNGTKIALLGVHLHWPLGPNNARTRDRELAGIATFAAATQEPLIVAGDFNVTPWSSHFEAALGGSALRDCAAGFGLAPSWPSQFPPVGIRIDHCLISRHWRSLDVRIGPRLGSDHLPVLAELSLAAPRA